MELMKVLEDIGEKSLARPDICQHIIQDMDDNGDMLMQCDEFVKMIMVFFLDKEKFMN